MGSNFIIGVVWMIIKLMAVMYSFILNSAPIRVSFHHLLFDLSLRFHYDYHLHIYVLIKDLKKA